MPDPNIPDPLREEFDRMEREVRQRECPHPNTICLQEFGKPPEYLCQRCGARLADEPE